MIRLSLRIVLGALIACAIWWIGPLIAIGVYHPLGPLLLRQILVAILLLWAFWPILVIVWAKLAMGPRRVRRQPKPAAAAPGGLAKRLADLDAQLRQRWMKANPGWRSRWIARWRAPHLAAQPWFLVVGASGSGKTTLLRRAGVGLNGHADLLGRNGSEEGHTVDANFWRAGNAIWIDINGLWLEGADEGAAESQGEWRSLLAALRKIGRAPHLDGVLLCVDCDWLLKASTETRKRVADGVRARLREMADLLGLQLPLYVAVSGLDKIPGATSFLSGLDDAIVENGLGFGFPASRGAPTGDVVAALYEDGMKALEERVQQHVLFMAPDTVDPERNAERLRFVEQLSRLRRHLGDYLGRSVLEGAAEGFAIRVRGVWLGSSIDLTGDDTASLLEADDVELEGYGVHRLAPSWNIGLRQMLEERGLATPTQPAKVRHRMWGLMAWGVAAVAACVIGAVLFAGYLIERNYLEQVWARFNEGKRLAEAQSAEAMPAAALVDVMTQMRYVNDNVVSTSQAVVAPYWEHTRVSGAAQATYRKHLRKSLMPGLYNYVGETLIAQLQGEPGDIYETLKVYLMLSRPQHRNADELIRWMDQQWRKLERAGSSGDDRSEYEAHLRALFSTAGMPATPEDSALVQEARARASQIPSVSRVIDRAKSGGLPAKVEDVSLASAGGFMASTMLRMRGDLSPTDAAIPGWYTRAGYQDVFKPRLRDAAMDTLEEESWVLRDEKLDGNTFEIEKAAEKLADAARAQFLQEYIRRWQTFLNDVTVRHYSGMDDAAQIASSFLDPQSPLALLLRFAGKETSLTGNYEGNVDSWIDRQKLNLERGRRAIVGELAGERARFRRLPEHVVDDHFEAIRRLGTELVKSASAGTGSNPLVRLFEPLARQLNLVNGAMLSGQVLPKFDAFARLRAQAGRQPEPIRGIVLDLVNSGSRAGVNGARSVLAESAASASRSFCQQGLQARYPFVRSAQAEVTVQDFERLFGPQGTMATHFQEHLAPYVDTSSSPWRARPADGDKGLVPADALASFESAQRIGASMLDEQGNLRIAVMLRVVDMDPQIGELLLEIGPTEIRYAHGSVARKQINWTGAAGGPGGKVYVRSTVRTVDGRVDVKQYDGPWALFRFFDSGRAVGSGADVRETVHQTPLGTVRLNWQSLSTPAPLWSRLLRSFSCPR
ncbi:type VI secretion system membrane subunit TssM [Variovorax sp.]|uniref:type VI secretion system membrane subunit TssM n=1 Tax=Variovorax sp. TaxID=1871043 RepID=UPI002D270296|nr:type VI secretion system membrane subunit TssM [Variovorax sp.]HYP86479.1 type VI secretion system membrane subunit TssM [Variovorax sp.]